jgi:site-specific recombinase XerD
MGSEIVSLSAPLELVSLDARLPAMFLADAKSSERFWEFFAANIRNTRRAYYRAACRFSDWCEGRGLFDLAVVKPMQVAAFIEELQAQAYAASGNMGQAIALLNEALSKSRKVRTDVFSSLQYKTVSRQEFVEETRKLLEQFKKQAPESLVIHQA